MKLQSKLLILAILIQIVYSNNCILHYCECPPFLSNDPSLKKSLFFNKYPYAEHYAILGRAKELHCCFGGNFTRISWFKDGQPYPWQNFGSSLPILFAKNQSLVIVSMTPQDEGKYKCMAMDEKEEVIEHETMLRSYSLPNFHHLPIWKNEPTDIEINQGETTKINCSAIVGPQYNSIKLQPVRAYWKNSQEQFVDPNQTKTIQEISNDEVVYGVELILDQNYLSSQDEKYTCVISNHYGMLSKTINIKIGQKISNETIKMEPALKTLFMMQTKIFKKLIKIVKKNPDSIMKQLDKIKIEDDILQ